MNENYEQKQSTVGLLLIFGDIVSNQQRDEILLYINKALKYIDTNLFNQVEDLFNNLIHNNEFQTGSLLYVYEL